MLLETTTFLGPAHVSKVSSARLRLELPDTEVTATLAIAYPYHPVVGDTVLAIGFEGKYFVIGVIQGTGKSRFVAPGDIEFHAPRGKIDFIGRKGVSIKGSRVGITADKIELTAKSITERFGDAYLWVKEVFQVRAKRERHIIEEKYAVKAGRIVERAEKDVKIDGEKINLG